MARTKTLAQLRSDVANQADIVGAAARYTPTLLTGLINQSIQRFRERISIEGTTHYLVSTSGTLSAGATSPYPFQTLDLSGVSPGLVRTFGVDIIIDGTVVTLEQRPFEERASFGTRPGIPIAWAHFQTDKIAILPAPQSSYSYTVWYLPLLADLTSDSDTFNGVAGWEDYVTWDVLSRLVVRDNYPELFGQVEAKANAIWTDIIRSATKVSHAGGAHKGRDTFGRVGALAFPRGSRGISGGGGAPIGTGSVTNDMLASMAARRIKGNAYYENRSPQDLTGAEVADMLPSFAGTAGGLVPTGASNPALFLSQAGWIAPTVGGGVSGLALTQLQDIHAPRVIGLFGTPTGAPTLLTGQHVASMIGVFTGAAHGLVPRPTGAQSGRALLDTGEWGVVASSGGGGPTMLAAGPAGAVQYNGGSGFAGASGFLQTASGLSVYQDIHLPTGSIQFGATGLPSPQALIELPHGHRIIATRKSDGSINMTVLTAGTGIRGNDIFSIGGTNNLGTEQRAALGGDHLWVTGGELRGGIDGSHKWLEPGMRLGLQQLAIPDSIGDKLASWTASGFANHATGIRVIASGQALSVGTGGPILHASGIDMRQGDIRNVRRINGLDGIKLYGDLPDSNANITAPSGTAWIIPETVTQGRVYSAVPTSAEHGVSVLIENRSAFAHSIYNTGTGLGAPSGWIATLAPSGGMSVRFASGAWEFGAKYQLGGF